MKNTYISLSDLEVYQLARELSKKAWQIFESLDWETKRVMGFQFIEATDSVGANIAEGYKRFHYLDRIKFYYNSRASLTEAIDHWLQLLFERGKIKEYVYQQMDIIAQKEEIKLSNFISSTYAANKTKNSK
ncbi:four helix bundle protein [Candidatus Roizmanbacteria bacterium RIFCSPHIGHO2_12_FULL_41_11]|uniref:Four helix bundle protein n=2 Tax=Candidatus Roizmaniibacteriota TaxID=1752723 RepID=A0A1F7J7V9_9BACT|nr:MAG: four helix bundle protein [Candidatus Roizmanbacteria bacterium RIFCSPHIGHO2_12_FULL_41_11]OGK51687.1 MAG: four helix bundle protein [Candidatus Roizmanbacteria bacterium RIFCSPLOWO2_01_FULL_41_22]